MSETKVRANAGCSTEYVCDGGGRGPCEKVAKTVREVQCLHVGGSGGVGSSGAGGVVVVALLVLLRCICARVLVGHALRRGRGSRSLSCYISFPLSLEPLYSPRLSSLSPSRRPSYRKRPSQARHYARWLCVANERPTNQTGKRQPGDKRNMLLRDRRARP